MGGSTVYVACDGSAAYVAYDLAKHAAGRRQALAAVEAEIAALEARRTRLLAPTPDARRLASVALRALAAGRRKASSDILLSLPAAMAIAPLRALAVEAHDALLVLAREVQTEDWRANDAARNRAARVLAEMASIENIDTWAEEYAADEKEGG